MSKALKRIEAYKRSVLTGFYKQLTESQQRKFKRIFGCIENVRNDKINDAIKICERAVRKNLGIGKKEDE